MYKYLLRVYTMLALFRHIQSGKPSYYITIAEKLLPVHSANEKLTITIVNPETWNTSDIKYAHIVKKKGRSKIHGSVKFIINREIVESLGLRKGDLVWVKVEPYDENPQPPPRKPYIRRPTRVHSDKSSLFFVMSTSQIDHLRRISGGQNLHVYVNLDGKTIDYIKSPILIKGENLYKILLPMTLFSGLIHVHDTIDVKIESTGKPEELFYTM